MASDQLQRDLDALANQIAALKLQLNPASGVRDNAVGIERDGSDNLVLFDVVTGPKTLAEVAAGGGGAATPRIITGTVTVDEDTVMVNHDITINNTATLAIEDGAALVLV